MQRAAWVCMVVLFCLTAVFAQQSNLSVPNLVNFSGTLVDASHQPLSGTVGVTFYLYTEPRGGSPLWVETHNVQPDKNGRYSVMLGSSTSQGLPTDVFASGQARWLGVQVQGQAELPRVMLLSVPYALKAGDAQTVGGLPPSAFVLAAPNGAKGALSAPSGSANSGSGPNVGGTGTQDFIPLWTDNSGDLGNSVLFQLGSGGTAEVGVNTTTPAATLDVNGGVISRGPLQLPSTGTANASQGFNSQPFSLQASSFNSSTQKAIGPLFQWQTEPVGNNTSSPSGSLNLLYGNGSGSSSETGLNIASTGLITFAKGQTFPGTGTITGVKAGTGLTGGGTSGTVTLSINTNFANQYYARLGAANTFTSNQTINANLTAQRLISTAAQGTAPLQVTSTTQVPNLNASFLGGLSAGAFQPAGAYATLGANTFTATQAITSGDLSLTNGNLDLPQTTSNTAGVLTLGGIPFLHACCSALDSNTFVGGAGNFTTTATDNTGLAMSALHSITSGRFNTAVGESTLFHDSTGASNTATGYNANSGNITGNLNVANGYLALYESTSGSNNTAIGAQALYYSSGGSNNTALGYNAGPDQGSTNLTNSTAIGANAVVSESNALVLGGTGTNAVNVGIGTATPQYTLDVQGTGNFTGLVNFAPNQTFPGTGTISGVTAGTGLSGGGSSGNVSLNVDESVVAFQSDLTNGINTAESFATAAANTAQNNAENYANSTFLPLTGGTLTGGLSGTTGIFTGIVSGSSFNISGSPAVVGYPDPSMESAFLGFAGNAASPGYQNTAVGFDALNANTTGSLNTAVGVGALGSNTTGVQNTASGSFALQSTTTGSGNTSSGYNALQINTAGSSNAAFGLNALRHLVSGNFNIALGQNAGVNLSANESNNIDIANQGTAGESGVIRIGTAGTQTNTYIAGITGVTPGGNNIMPVVIDNNGQLGTGGTNVGTITGVTAGTGLTGGGTSGNVSLGVDESVVAFQSDLTNGINTAESFATAAATTAQNNAESYANSTFLPLTGGTLTGPLNLPANGLVADTNQFVLSNGLVGIGTVGPRAPLEIVPPTDTPQLYLVQPNDNRGGWKLWAGVDGSFHVISTQFGAQNEVFTITQGPPNGNGNIGIGTTNPQALLEVNGTAKFDNTVTFVAGQTFPGTGTISGVAAGTGLSGGGTSGTVSLNVNESVVAFQSDLTNGINTAESFATAAANTAQNNAENYSNSTFLPLSGGTLTGAVSGTTFSTGGLTFNSSGLSGSNGGCCSNPGTPISLVAGGGYNQPGGKVSITAGVTSSWSGAGASADVVLQGGTMENGNNTGASIDVGGGKAVTGGSLDADGGTLTLAGGNASGNSRSGGNIVLSTGSATGSGANGQFLATASGGITFFTNSAQTTGVSVAAGGGSWSSVSDRNAKENFASVDNQSLLAEVLALSITSWNYKAQDKHIRHIGPMAQDFFAAFKVGEDDRHITEIDEGGVAFAAVQGLNQKLENEIKKLRDQSTEKDAQIEAAQTRLAAQQKQIDRLQSQLGDLLLRVKAIETHGNAVLRAATTQE